MSHKKCTPGLLLAVSAPVHISRGAVRAHAAAIPRSANDDVERAIAINPLAAPPPFSLTVRIPPGGVPVTGLYASGLHETPALHELGITYYSKRLARWRDAMAAFVGARDILRRNLWSRWLLAT